MYFRFHFGNKESQKMILNIGLYNAAGYSLISWDDCTVPLLKTIKKKLSKTHNNVDATFVFFNLPYI